MTPFRSRLGSSTLFGQLAVLVGVGPVVTATRSSGGGRPGPDTARYLARGIPPNSTGPRA